MRTRFWEKLIIELLWEFHLPDIIPVISRYSILDCYSYLQNNNIYGLRSEHVWSDFHLLLLNHQYWFTYHCRAPLHSCAFRCSLKTQCELSSEVKGHKVEDLDDVIQQVNSRLAGLLQTNQIQVKIHTSYEADSWVMDTFYQESKRIKNI